MNKEYLTEEQYQKTNRKLKKISIIILIVGISIALLLITMGKIKSININKENQKIEKEIRENAIKTRENNEKLISNLETEIEELKIQERIKEQEKIQLNQEISKIFSEDRGFSNRYYEKENEINSKRYELTEITKKRWEKETEKSNLEFEQKKYDEESINSKIESSKINDFESKGFYYGAIPVIMFSVIISLSLYIQTKQRKIIAYQTQQAMPIAKEGIEKMAPSLGKAGAIISKEMTPVYKDIAKEISEGIKEGLKNDDNNNQ